jgi:hypothetical protein
MLFVEPRIPAVVAAAPDAGPSHRKVDAFLVRRDTVPDRVDDLENRS